MTCPTQTSHILPSPNIPPIQLCAIQRALPIASSQPSLRNRLRPQPKITISFHNSHPHASIPVFSLPSVRSTYHRSSSHLSHNVTRQTHSPISKPSPIPRPAMTQSDRGSKCFHRKFIHTSAPRQQPVEYPFHWALSFSPPPFLSLAW